MQAAGRFFKLFCFGLLVLSWPIFVQAEEPSADSPLYQNDLRCWTEEVCTADADSSGAPDGRFDKDSYEAKMTCGGSSYGLCYPPEADFSLSVALPITGTVTTKVSGLGDYINKLFLYLLSISSIIAVLMLMVGGVKYIISPDGEQTSKAKEQINKALTGLVLLFCATLILFTVNPQLIKLEMPPIPRTRPVFFVSDTTTCEELIAVGYTVNPTSGVCGDDAGTITKDANGNDISTEEKTCRWSTCTTSSYSCIELEPKDQCSYCSLVTSSNPSGVEISSGLCSGLTPEDLKNADNSIKKDFTCFLTTDSDLGVSDKKCGLAVVTCDSVTDCSNYDNQPVVGNAASTILKNFSTNSGSDYDLQAACEDDPCEVVKKKGKGCKFVVAPPSTVGSCVSQ